MPTSTPQIVTRLVQLGESSNPADNFHLRAEGDGALSIARCSDGRVAALIGADNKVTFPGNAQTLQDVLSSRSAATPYTNATGQLITVLVSLKVTSPNTYNTLTAVVGGVPMLQTTRLNTVSGDELALTFPVPAGGIYQVNAAGSSSYTIPSWKELR